MDIAKFQNSSMGTLVPVSGQDAALGRHYSHFAFVPNPLPLEIAYSSVTVNRMVEAAAALGRLDAMSQRIPNPNLLVRPALLREAVSTSALEGTHAMFQDLLEAEFISVEKQSAEVKEVTNYVIAAYQGLTMLQKLPICVSLLKALQKTLVSGTRGDFYDAGQLRRRQVFIGERGRGIDQARFVPPPPGAYLIDGMSDWEKWINNENEIPPLVKMALGHYQFETLHPFTDGNGRLGRLIVTLQMINAKILRYPILNISPWLEQHKDEYIHHLLQVSVTGEMDPWLQFFFEAIRVQADFAVEQIERIVVIRQKMRAGLKSERARGIVLDLVDDLIEYPAITVPKAAERHNITFAAANNAIRKLVGLGYLTEVTGKSYGRVFISRQMFEAIDQGPL